MNRFPKHLPIACLVLVLIFIILGLSLRTNYSVNRSIIIAAETAAIHEYVRDLKKWPDGEPHHRLI